MTKDMLRIRRRLEMEVEDILCPQLFSYYHENRTYGGRPYWNVSLRSETEGTTGC